MKLEFREDIAAPKARVLEAVTDMERFERTLRDWGVAVERSGEGPLAPGAVWTAHPEWQGRRFDLTATLLTLGEDGWTTECHAAGLIGLIVCDLVELGPSRTRLYLGVETRATSIGGRVLLGSLTLAQGGIERRVGERLSRFAQSIGGEAA